MTRWYPPHKHPAQPGYYRVRVRVVTGHEPSGVEVVTYRYGVRGWDGQQWTDDQFDGWRID